MSKAYLLGLDFGSTTSHAMLASAHIVRNCVTGRMELAHAASVYRSPGQFTPFIGDRIDENRIDQLLAGWIAAAGVDPRMLLSGGAIVTGLAAEAANAETIAKLVRTVVGDAVIAVAQDPCLESWLAMMGSCGELLRANPEMTFLNLDIGGGTTNLAVGRHGQVPRVGCLWVGARHFQVKQGTYHVTGLSRYAVALLEHLGVAKTIGDDLTDVDVGAITDFYVGLIEAAIRGDHALLGEWPASLHERARFEISPGDSPTAITLSGGVGELVYRHVQGEGFPPTTAFGDLGIDLARRILRSPHLSAHLKGYTPANFGRATVYGLTLHQTEVSGTTLYLPDPGILPLRDLPIVASLSKVASLDEASAAVRLAGGSLSGAAIQILPLGGDLRAVQELGGYLAMALRRNPLPRRAPLVLFVADNAGKALGNYATEWGQLDVNLIAIDELDSRGAKFASVGAVCDNVAPVSFYGMQATAD